MSKSWPFERLVRRKTVTGGVRIGVLTAAVLFVSQRLTAHAGTAAGVDVADPAIAGTGIGLHVSALAGQASVVVVLISLVVIAALLIRSMRRQLVTGRQELSLAVADSAAARAQAGDLEARLAESETRFRSIFESAALGMAVCNGEGQLLRVNRSLCDLLGYSARELEQTNLLAVTHADDVANASAVFRAVAGGAAGPFRLEQRYLTSDARVVIAKMNLSVVRDSQDRVLYCTAQIQDITSQRRSEESITRYRTEMEALALTDDLTGLDNRRGFRKVSEPLCAAQTRSRQPLMLVAVDVDYLKAINDTWGHAEGDRAIVIVAQALSVSFRTSDVVARVGGDEFLCLLPNAGEDDVTQIRHRIATRIARELEQQEFPVPVTVTVGVAIAAPYSQIDLDKLMREADRAMYDAKRGRPTRDLAGVRLS